MWIVLDLVRGLVLLMYCLPTVKSEDCQNFDIIVGQHGEKLEYKFLLSDLKDEYNKYITEYNNRNITRRNGKKIVLNNIQIQDLRKESNLMFKKKMNSLIKDKIYLNGKQTYLAGNLTEIFMTNDAFVVKRTKLQKQDAGIYWIEFRSTRLGQKVWIITGKPTITGRSPPNPVLKPEDNYTSNIQLECHSVSTSIGDCQLSMYTVWYKNGMRMSDVDTTLSLINVTVDHNGSNFTCLATDYPPCYQRLNNTKHYDEVLNIEECNAIFHNKTVIVQPEYPPIDVKLEPDQREITVNKNKDFEVRCSAKCHPKCDVRWVKDFQDLKLNGSINITENSFENDLKIVNFNNSDEGVYVCLVNNIHGEVIKGFTLSVKECRWIWGYNIGVLGFLIYIAFIIVAIVITCIVNKKYKESVYIKKIYGIGFWFILVLQIITVVICIIVKFARLDINYQKNSHFYVLIVCIISTIVVAIVLIVLVIMAIRHKKVEERKKKRIDFLKWREHRERLFMTVWRRSSDDGRRGEEEAVGEYRDDQTDLK